MSVLKKLFELIRRANKIILFFVLFFALFFSYVVFNYFHHPYSENHVAYCNNNNDVLGLNIPKNLSFCGERIPSNDVGIKEDLEKEFFYNSYWKSNSLVLFNKAQKWFPYIEPILKDEGVPEDFKYLAVIESHLSNVTSPAGAAGFWQLVNSSAQNYGLEINAFVDERYDVEKSTHAACKHIKEAYAIFKNWTLAAAAYNRGIGGIQNALKQQATDNYFDLLLNSETGSFVYRILAYKTLFSSPTHFGLKNKKWKYFPKIQYKVFNVDTTINNLNLFAKKIGCNVAMIKLFNPWLLQNSLNNAAKKVYQIKIPKNLNADYSDYLKDLLGEMGDLGQNEGAKPENKIIVQDSIVNLIKPIIYTVRINEPLKNIATFYKVKLEDLLKWNNLQDVEVATAGQTLTIFYNPEKK